MIGEKASVVTLDLLNTVSISRMGEGLYVHPMASMTAYEVAFAIGSALVTDR